MLRSNEPFLLSGWLFADLLLALAVLFLAANTATIQPIPPILDVTPTNLDINNRTPNCTLQTLPDGTSVAQCTISITEAKGSKGDLNWSVSSDISESIQYTINNQAASSGRLSPGQQKTLTISAIPCQNGSFTFQAKPADGSSTPINSRTVVLKCKTPKERLDFNYQTFQLTVNDVNALLSSNSQDDNIKQQVRSQTILSNKSVGITVVYAGSPGSDFQSIDRARRIAQKIDDILDNLGKEGFSPFSRSSFYRRDAFNSDVQKKPLYNLGDQPEKVQVDVYFFTQQ
jgi:hypothetical protein